MARAASIPGPTDHLRSATSSQTIGPSELVASAWQLRGWTGQQIAVSLTLVLADALAFCIAIGAGAATAHVFNLLFASNFDAFEARGLVNHLVLWSGVVIAVCVWYAWSGHYTQRRSFEDDLKAILGPLFVGLLVNGFLHFAAKASFSRLWLVSGWVIAVLVVPLGRIAARRLLDSVGLWRRDALVIGSGSHLASVSRSLTAGYFGYDVSVGGAIPADKAGVSKFISGLGARVSGPIILVPSQDEFQRLDALVDGLNTRMISYAVVPPFQKLPLANLAVHTFVASDVVMLTVKNGLASPMSQFCKRAFDVAVSSALLFMLSPIFVVLSLLIARDGGPVFFSHSRIGRGGRVFGCMKFRSMVPNAAEVLECHLTKDAAARDEWMRSYKLQDDPRKTWIGGILRSTSLDELPQLLNVLRGDMSLVGPRPVVQDELHRYYGTSNAYYLMVRPGITGVWQVSGRSETGYDERVYLDAWYVRNWSMWNDIMVLCRTIPVVITGRGAY